MWFLPKTRQIKCPDGTTREVYRDIDKAFPLYASNVNFASSATANAAEQVQANLQGDYKRELAQLFFSVDECNRSIQAHFRAAYVTYSASPCLNMQVLIDAIEAIRITEDKFKSSMLHLRTLQVFMESGALDPKSISTLVAQAAEALLPKPQNSDSLIGASFAAVPDITEEWKQ